MGTQFKIKLPVFKKKECPYLYNNFFVKVLGTLFPNLNENKNSKIVLWWHQLLDLLNVFGTNHISLPTPPFTQIFPNMQ